MEQGLISGGGPKRVQPDYIESVDIPLPPLETQRAIVDRWQAAQAEAARQQIGLRRWKRRTDNPAAFPGARPPRKQTRHRRRVLVGRPLARDAPLECESFNQAPVGCLHRAANPAFRPLGELLADLEATGRVKSRENSHGEGMPVLRIGNIKNHVLDLTDLKYVPLPTPAKKSLLHFKMVISSSSERAEAEIGRNLRGIP